jgi:tricorn protease
MKTESRALAAFIGCGILLLGAALVLPRLSPEESPVDHLPTVSTAPAAKAAPSAKAGPGSGTAAPVAAASPENVPHLMRHPALSSTQIAFDFAGEIWVAPREGGEARRLVTGQLRNSRPIFSPDGSSIAFSGIYDGNLDVYVVPAAGGEPRRLTHYPGPDGVLGWTPDGTRVLFWSMRATPRDLPKLFTVPATGGSPDELPLPSGADASFSPDGKRLAYIPYPQWQPGWKKYRGGQTTPIWIADLADSRITKVPRTDSNDRAPMWIGDTVYFLSDRNGPFTLFGYDVKAAAVRELVHNPDGFDMRSASAGPGAIVYEQLGEVQLFDIASGKSHAVPITITADLPQVRPRFARVDPDQILHAAVSPTGKRVLFEARGEILAVPAEKGDARNLTRSPGVADRDPAWSPDGKWIAWLSDQEGEYALYFRAPDGLGPVKKVDLGDPPSFFYAPRWSPDSKKILVKDKRLNLWLIDLSDPKPVKVDTGRFEGADFDATWAPDSRWISYVKELENHLHAVFVYSLDEKKARRVTDGRSDVSAARFDRSGKYLWFLAATDVGLGQSGGMTAMGHPTTASVYAAVLRKDLPSPVAPESDEEGDADKGDKADKEKADKEKADKEKAGAADKGEKGGKADKEKAAKAPKEPVEPMRIDFEGLDQRIVALPIDRANYWGLEAGAEGVLFLLVAPVVFTDEDYIEYSGDNPVPVDVMRFELKTRKAEKFADKIRGGLTGGGATFFVTADGKKVLFAKDKDWYVAPSDKPFKGDGKLKLDGLEVWIDPRAEWRQIYREVWRIERDFLYDPGFHGLDLAAGEKLYARFLDGIAGRDDLNALLEEGLGNLVLGHVWAQGGALPSQSRTRVGLLGADYRIEDGRYRIARILQGENWNPALRAPLTEPGVDVKEGDFLLTVNGQELKADDDVHRLFLGRADLQTVIRVASNATGANARQVTVVPVPSDANLRLRTWMEDSRKKVDELSGGRVGYVYIPDTGGEGFTNFNRYYFSQVGKEAVVLDERFNHGGQIADYMVNILGWAPIMGATTREGEDVTLPSQAIFGPKVMIANQMSGSGGDALPWLFKKAKLGPLVGVRTWGGLVGIGGYPRLLDGGRITAPRWALYGTEGQWEVENHGIAPDVEVEQDPLLVRQGHDPQLERAVQLALDALAKNPPKKLVRPAYPNYGPRLPATH